MGLYDEHEDDPAGSSELPRHVGCAPRLAALIIVFFVNAPLVREGPGDLWRIAPLLVVVAIVVDLFVLGFLVVTRLRRGVRDSEA